MMGSLPSIFSYTQYYMYMKQYYHHFYFAVEETGTNRLNHLLKNSGPLVEVRYDSATDHVAPKPMHCLSERDTEAVITVHYGVRLKSVLYKKDQAA